MGGCKPPYTFMNEKILEQKLQKKVKEEKPQKNKRGNTWAEELETKLSSGVGDKRIYPSG
jgi:hypothetical protein